MVGPPWRQDQGPCWCPCPPHPLPQPWAGLSSGLGSSQVLHVQLCSLHTDPESMQQKRGWDGREDNVLPGLCPPGEKPAPFLTPLHRRDHSERGPFYNCPHEVLYNSPTATMGKASKQGRRKANSARAICSPALVSGPTAASPRNVTERQVPSPPTPGHPNQIAWAVSHAI